MKRRIELLAPAGDPESLHAAVENGADAVYLGGRLFNARQSASNFDIEELKKEAYYAHARGVNLYLTLNTLIADNELQEALSFAGEAWLAGVDGIIVQDLGLARALHGAAPEIPLHASTQLTIYDLEGVRMLEKLGFKKVVLARELTLDEIRRISAGSSIEIEIFIHGALCVSYSGQCLMSSLIGSRSGNRGKCAQPCRLPYRLLDRQNEPGMTGKSGKAKGTPSYLMSTKDLCSLDLLEEIAASGVSSLKIEGRLKSPEYVATVVRIYRKYLDLAMESVESGVGAVNPSARESFAERIEEEDMHDLLQAFNRGGFSKGYLKGKTGADMMSYESPKNRGIYLGRTLSYDRPGRSLTLKLEDGISIGDGVEVLSGEMEHPGTIVTSIRKNNAAVKCASKGDVAAIGNISNNISGNISGNIPKGAPVYKTSDKSLNEAARESFTGRPHKRVAIRCSAELLRNRPFALKVSDDDGNEAAAEGSVIPEAAINKPLGRDRLSEQLQKTGATPFELKDLEINLDEGITLPVSEINEVRRKALELLEEKRAGGRIKSREHGAAALLERLKKANHPTLSEQQGKACSVGKTGEADVADGMQFAKSIPLEVSPSRKRNAPGLSLYFYKWDKDFKYSELEAQRLYLPLSSMYDKNAEVIEACKSKGKEVFIWLPVITRGNYEAVIDKYLSRGDLSRIDGVLAANPGTVERLRNVRGIRLVGDHHLNVFNELSAVEAYSMGLEGITLSLELTLGQASSIASSAQSEVEAAVYGRLPLMTSEYCPVGSLHGGFKGGVKCSEACRNRTFFLKDRMDMDFPVVCDRVDCRSTILNSNVLFVPDAARKLATAGVDLLRLYIFDESHDTVKRLLSIYGSALSGRENLGRDEEALIESIKKSGHTKGHYFRGV